MKRKRREVGRPRSAASTICDAGPYQNVAVPDGRQAVFGNRIDLHLRLSGFVEDRRETLCLGQGEERPLHQIALVARRHGAGEGDEWIETRPFALEAGVGA